MKKNWKSFQGQEKMVNVVFSVYVKEGEGMSRNMYKDPRTKATAGQGRSKCGRWGWVWLGRVMGGGEMGTAVIEQ